MKYAREMAVEQTLIVRDYRPEDIEEKSEEGKSMSDDSLEKKKVANKYVQEELEEEKGSEGYGEGAGRPLEEVWW